MTVTLELPRDIEERFIAEAKVKGVSVGELLTDIIVIYAAPEPNPLGRRDVNKGLDEAADLIPDGIPVLSDVAMSRETIYTREDDWNR